MVIFNQMLTISHYSGCFFHAKSLKKVEVLQKRALRFLYDDYNSPLEEILKKPGKVCM